MLNVKIEARAKCRKHPNYDPAKDGEAGIKGGCGTCMELLAYLGAVLAFERKSIVTIQRCDEGTTALSHRYANNEAGPIAGSARFDYGCRR